MNGGGSGGESWEAGGRAKLAFAICGWESNVISYISNFQ